MHAKIALQELLAPHQVRFFNSSFEFIGDKHDLLDLLQLTTGIPRSYFSKKRRTPMRDVPIAERMRWASQRKTTRDEDMAYCLMGIFNVNMPLL